MTVASKVKTCLAEMKGIEASLQFFYEEARDEKTRQLYQQQTAVAKRIIDRLQTRLFEIELEEPQYKSY